jgi:hypothetical protein
MGAGTQIARRRLLAIVSGTPVFAIRGSDGGYHTEGDLLGRTADGVDLNEMWAEFQQTLNIFNERRQTLVNFLTFPVVNMIENVPQVGSFDFDEASEFGEPTAGRIPLGVFSLGYDFKDYDKATRWTWKFLRDAPASHLEATHSAVLEADNRLIFRKVMEAIFDNRNRSTDINQQNYSVYALYNADGTVPPPYKGTTFLSTHDHYLVSGAATIDPGDIEALYNTIREHGYGQETGTQYVALVNRAQMEVIKTWRFGQTYGGVVSNYDFIPAPGQPTLIVPNQQGLLGSLPPASFGGLPVKGSWGDIWFIEEEYIPAGYVLMFGTGGAANLQNPVGIREHANAAHRGLRLFPGNQQRYPLVESFYSRGFGTGVRQRGGAAVMQIKVSGTYDIPTQYMRGGGLG